MPKNNLTLISGALLGFSLLLGIVLWTQLHFQPQYDEPAHLAFSKYLAHHPVIETVKTYKGSQNYEAKGPVFFLTAALFGEAAGFELEHLRFLTLIFSMTAIVGFALLLRLIPEAPPESAALFVCLPYYLVLSITFMTDVPSVALLLFGLYGYLYFLKTNQAWYAVAGIMSVTLVAYIRIDYIYILAGIVLGCLLHSQLTTKIVALILLPIVLRIPLVLAWGGLAPPTAQARGHAMVLGFNPQYLIFVLAAVGLYFWPFLVDSFLSQRQRTLRTLLISSIILVPAGMFFAPHIFPDNIDQYAGIIRSLLLALNLGHVSQMFLWTALAVIGTTVSYNVLRPDPSTDTVVSCIKAACLLGILIQIFRGQVIYERYLLEVSPLLLLLCVRGVAFRPTLWLWSAWMLGMQLMQFARKSLV